MPPVNLLSLSSPVSSVLLSPVSFVLLSPVSFIHLSSVSFALLSPLGFVLLSRGSFVLLSLVRSCRPAILDSHVAHAQLLCPARHIV